jgi:DNA-binding NarL/FixJ family response regulator
VKVTGLNRDGSQHDGAKVVIISSNTFVRLGLRRTLEGHAGAVVVGECAWGASARRLVEEAQPDLIVKDLEVDLNQAEVLTELRQAAPLARIVVLTGWGEREHGREVMEAAGDIIIMMKCQPPSLLLALIDHVVQSRLGAPGRRLRSSPLDVDELREKEDRHEPTVAVANPTVSSLTKRERDLVALVGEGLSNRDISERLCISDTTVRHHLTAIFDKVGVSSRQKLLVFAYRNGLAELQLSA